MSAEQFPDQETKDRNRLNFAIWQKIYTLVSESPNREDAIPGLSDGRFTATSTEEEEAVGFPKIFAHADPLTEEGLTAAGKFAQQHASDAGPGALVASIAIGSTSEQAGTTSGAYNVYYLFQKGHVNKQVFVGFPGDEMPEIIGSAPDISLLERRELLNTLDALGQIS